MQPASQQSVATGQTFIGTLCWEDHVTLDTHISLTDRAADL